jgi:hypothetical protein
MAVSGQRHAYYKLIAAKTMPVKYLIAYGTRMCVVMASSLGQFKFLVSFCSHVVVLHHTKNNYTKVVYFRKSITGHHGTVREMINFTSALTCRLPDVVA